MSNSDPALIENYLRSARVSANDMYYIMKSDIKEKQKEIELVLLRFCENLELDVEKESDYTIIHDRKTEALNRLIFTYASSCSNHREDKALITDKFDSLKEYEFATGVILSENRIVFLKRKEGRVLSDEVIPISEISMRRFLYSIVEVKHGNSALNADNLSKMFALNNPHVKKLIRIFINSLQGSLLSGDSKEYSGFPVYKYFLEWSQFFKRFADYTKAFKGDLFIKLKKWVKRTIDFDIKNADDAQQFFFALHTYLALLSKLLAWLALSRLSSDGDNKISFSDLCQLDDEQLLYQLRRAESGGVFDDFKLKNFWIDDFFSWYLEVWNSELAEVLRNIIHQISLLNPSSVVSNRETTHDLFKKLHHVLIPREIRHSLGEYYTPDWLAEYLLRSLEPDLFSYQNSLPQTLENSQKLREKLNSLRFLDPTCGSGTFLLIILNKMLKLATYLSLSPNEFLCRLVHNVVGFDINPLAVLIARVNYLFAVSEWIDFANCSIEIPVYVADSTQISSFIDEKTGNDLFSILNDSSDSSSRDLDIYEFILGIHKDKISAMDKFDYVVGNPPWINWTHLPEDYRNETRPLWNKYKIFARGKGSRARLGAVKVDIASLITYVAADKFLKMDGRLGFIVTQSLLKGSASGAGFRRFILPDGTPLRVVRAEDLVDINPFEGASTRTALIILQKGQPTTYPVPYILWKRKSKT